MTMPFQAATWVLEVISRRRTVSRRGSESHLRFLHWQDSAYSNPQTTFVIPYNMQHSVARQLQGEAEVSAVLKALKAIEGPQGLL